MTEKILKTRIKLRYDTLDAWNLASQQESKDKLLLKSGEVAVVAVPGKDENGKPTTAPSILCKVGDGSSYFKHLPWTSGLAADVYDWAKSANPGDSIVIESSGTGNVVTNVDWDTTKNKIVVTKGNIVVPGGTGGEATTANDTKVISSATLNNHTLNTATKEIKGDTTSGIIVTGNNNIITVKGPNHQIASGNATTSYSHLISQDPTTKALTFQPGILSATKEEDGHFIKLEGGPLIGQGVLEPGTSSLMLFGAGARPIYAPTDLTDNFKEIALLEDIKDITITPKTLTGDHATTDDVTVVSNISASGHTITQTGTKVPTKKYVDEQIAAKVSSAVQYWGIITSANDLGKDMTTTGTPIIHISKGDFYRIGKDFEQYRIGDLLIAEKDDAGSTISNYSLLKQEHSDGTVKSVTEGNLISVTGTTTINPVINHATVTAPSKTGTENTREYITSVTTDGYGHITGYKTHTESDQAHQHIKSLDTTSATSLTTGTEAIAGTGNIQLHKIAKTGTYSDLLNRPDKGYTVNASTGIQFNNNLDPQTFSIKNQWATGITNISVKNWSHMLYYQEDNKLRDNNDHTIILDGGEANTW